MVGYRYVHLAGRIRYRPGRSGIGQPAGPLPVLYSPKLATIPIQPPIFG